MDGTHTAIKQNHIKPEPTWLEVDAFLNEQEYSVESSMSLIRLALAQLDVPDDGVSKNDISNVANVANNQVWESMRLANEFGNGTDSEKWGGFMENYLKLGGKTRFGLDVLFDDFENHGALDENAIRGILISTIAALERMVNTIRDEQNVAHQSDAAES